MLLSRKDRLRCMQKSILTQECFPLSILQGWVSNLLSHIMLLHKSDESAPVNTCFLEKTCMLSRKEYNL